MVSTIRLYPQWPRLTVVVGELLVDETLELELELEGELVDALVVETCE